jgi:hypothetical protein
MGVRRIYFAFMAKQAGEIFIRGTIDDLCFYKMDGVYYVRLKSSLTGKKFWKNKAFEGSRKSCKRFAEGNKLASKVYRMIEEEKRFYKIYCFLKRRAILLLKEGLQLQEAEEILIGYLFDFGLLKKTENKKTDVALPNKKICLSCEEMICKPDLLNDPLKEAPV